MNCLALSRALNQVWAELTNLGVKRMPEMVFDDFDDYMAVIEALPIEAINVDEGAMLSGFRFRWRGASIEPVNHAQQFVDQEIGP